MLNRSVQILILLISLLAGCNRGAERSEAIGEAHVGPQTLELRAELAPEAAITATVNHGERVQIIEWRRRFAKVRTARGTEGWADGRMLLGQAQMAGLRRLSMRAARLPSQGRATVYDALNVHTAPNREAPSFYQIQEGVTVHVLAHRVAPRVPYSPPTDEQEILLQPLYQPDAEEPEPSVPSDDWSLVRMHDGRVGWALTQMLVMAVPNEVAQYAEGQRITSYFSLGAVEDGDQIKHHWLWTTLSATLKPHEFDSLRVFVWSLRRHRYETAYIERNLVGYYPTEVHPVDESPGTRSAWPRFSVITREKDGLLYQRTYAFNGYRVRMVDKDPWFPPAPVENLRPGGRAAGAGPPSEESFYTGIKQKLAAWRDRLFGH